MTSDQAGNSAGRQGLGRKDPLAKECSTAVPDEWHYEAGGWLDAVSAG